MEEFEGFLISLEADVRIQTGQGYCNRGGFQRQIPGLGLRNA